MCELANPAFTDEDKAREFLETSRWPDGPFCPFCGQLDTVAKLGGKSMGPGWYYCSSCRDKFTASAHFTGAAISHCISGCSQRT